MCYSSYVYIDSFLIVPNVLINASSDAFMCNTHRCPSKSKVHEKGSYCTDCGVVNHI